MDVLEFRANRNWGLHYGVLPFREGAIHTDLTVSLSHAASPEHGIRTIREGMSERVECSCGWESKGYIEGWEEAWNQWVEHVATEMGLVPKNCPCGKQYFPVDGGKPCHELRAIVE